MIKHRSAALAVEGTVVLSTDRPDFKVIETKSGPIQFAAPAESLKPVLEAGRPVPQILVLAPNFVVKGALVNEVEFFIFYNVFFKFRKPQIIGTAEQLAAVRAIMQESFFGPLPTDLGDMTDLPEEHGYFQKELEHFRAGTSFVLNNLMKIPHDPSQGLPTLGHFIDLIECNKGQSVYLKAGRFVSNKTHGIDTVLRHAMPGIYTLTDLSDPKAGPSTINMNLLVPVERPVTEFANKKFILPAFGRTIMGSSHGFDHTKHTTSLILWADGRGIFVDPLVDPKGELHRRGISEDLVPFIFLTHVHADHDSGTMKMIVNGQRRTIIATKVVFEAFVRKGWTMGVDVRQYVNYIEVMPNQIFDGKHIGMPNLKLHISPGNFHSVPVVGFKAVYTKGGANKSYWYSCDTLFDPAKYDELVASGVMTRARADALLKFGWDADFIDHEAGVPPIHTPQKIIQDYADTLGVTNRILLVHTHHSEQGIRIPVAEEGSTLRIVEAEADATRDVIEVLESNPILSNMTMAQARKLRIASIVETHPSGAEIIQEGSRDQDLYIVISGRASVERAGESIAILNSSDFFGEEALLTGKPRSASVLATTETRVLRIPRAAALGMLKEFPSIAATMQRTIELRPHLSRVGILRDLPTTAFAQLIDRCKKVPYRKGENIVNQGELGNHFFILLNGQVEVWAEGKPEPVALLKASAVFGEISLLTDAPRNATVRVSSDDAEVLAISRDDFKELIEQHPAVHFGLTQLAQARSGVPIRP